MLMVVAAVVGAVVVVVVVVVVLTQVRKPNLSQDGLVVHSCLHTFARRLATTP